MNLPKWKHVFLAAAALGLVGTAACGDDTSDPDKNKVDYTPEQACSFSTDEDDQLVPEYPDADCDGDLMSNGFELAHGFDPKDPDENGNGQLDGWDDPDDDGLPNWAEEALGLDPHNPKTPVDDAAQSELLDGLKDSDGDGSVNMAEAWMATPKVNANPRKGELFLEQEWDPADPKVSGFQCNPNVEEDERLFEDMAFRFTSLKIREPNQLGSILSRFMDPDIEHFVINIMAPVTNFDRTHCVSYFDLYAASGDFIEDDSVEGGKVFKIEDLSGLDNPPPVTEPVRAVVIQTGENTAFFRTTVPLDMIFPGMEPQLGGGDPSPENRDRFMLPLAYITAAGTLTMNEDGSVALKAALDGSIPVEAANDTNVDLGDTILNVGDALKGQPQLKIPDKDGENFQKNGGFGLRATFNAITVPFDFGD